MKELKLNLKPMISKLELHTKREVMGELEGNYVSFFIGKGYDFEGYRKYTLHDDSRDIDWKASMRSRDLLMRIMSMIVHASYLVFVQVLMLLQHV